MSPYNIVSQTTLVNAQLRPSMNPQYIIASNVSLPPLWDLLHTICFFNTCTFVHTNQQKKSCFQILNLFKIFPALYSLVPLFWHLKWQWSTANEEIHFTLPPWQLQLFPGGLCNRILSHVSPRFVKDTRTTHFQDFSSFTSAPLNPSIFARIPEH